MDSEKKKNFFLHFVFIKVRWSKVEVAIIFNSKQLQKRKTYFIIFILYFIKRQKGKKATTTTTTTVTETETETDAYQLKSGIFLIII